MPVISVSQLNNYIKRYVDQNKHLTDLWIKGEISNFKLHYSGHMYFTLKDSNSTIRAMVFQSYTSNIKFVPKEGMKVIAFGKVSVYEAGGIYQLYVESMIPDGIGELYASYEQLKARLEAQGLFSVEKKRTIPLFPQKIGIISSISGAALRDILNVISRRYPISRIIIYPAKVQGIGAADSLCEGLKFFSDSNLCDVIILARGGGSIEDLWAFNEEKTALAIYECKIPVITGIGHETDYTISDFVSDMRAPTPSAAAEIAVPDLKKLKEHIKSLESVSGGLVNKYIDNCLISLNKYNTQLIKSRLDNRLELYKGSVLNLAAKADAIFSEKLNNLCSSLSSLTSVIEALNPENVLKRGYAMVQDMEGKIADFNKLSKNDIVNVLFDKGQAQCEIRRIIYEK